MTRPRIMGGRFDIEERGRARTVSDTVSLARPFIGFFLGLALLLSPTLASRYTRTAFSQADPRFGAVETYDAPGAAAEMGAGWTRIPFLWSEMQPNRADEWLPPISDETLALEIAQGRQLVGLVITTPAWATDVGIGPGVPRGLYTGFDDPNNLWAAYLHRLVSTYAGRIDHWIIWNEPDVWDPSHPGYTWGGSVEDFLQLQRVAYQAIKAANPNAALIFSGTSYWWDVAHGRDLFFRKYLDLLVKDANAAGNDYYCDAVALHVYFQPDFVFTITALYHQLMREHGFDKPIWIVETNAAPSLDPQMPAPGGQFAITLDEQAAYIVQAFAMGIAGGATRISVFKMIDTPSDLLANPEPFGLLRADGSRRPAFYAYRVATRYLAGFQSGRLVQRPDVSIVSITRVSGTTTVAWTRTPAPIVVEIPANGGSATLVDMWGNQRALSSSGGVYTVSLPGASCTHSAPCIIGGSPYMVVEGNVSTLPSPDRGPPPQPPTSDPSDQDAQVATKLGDQATAVAPPTATLRPKYDVTLRSIEMKGAHDVWIKRGLLDYQIELVAGPPVYLYKLTVINEVVTAASRSMDPLTLDLNDLESRQKNEQLTAAMTTLYNRRALNEYTVTGLFDRIAHYHQGHPSIPACDTEVTVKLDSDWAFPRRIVERWDDDCDAIGEPSWLAVVAFSTLTPTPTTRPTLAATAAATPSTAATTMPQSTAIEQVTAAGTALRTANRTPSFNSTSTVSRTPLEPEATSRRSPLVWVVILTGAVALGTLLIRRNGKSTDHKTD